METDEEVAKLDSNLKNEVEYNPVRSPIKRMNYFWKDKSGKEISYKEFMERWKTGMKGVTQYQQTKMQLNSTYIMLIGIACGFVITLFNFKNLWWLTIILGAAFFNTGIGALGTWQKKLALGEMEKLIQEAEE